MAMAEFSRCMRIGGLVVVLLSWQAAAAADSARSERIDQEWRDRFIYGWHADKLRDGRAAKAKAQAAVEQIRADTGMREQLRAWAQLLFVSRWQPSIQDYCPAFTHYISLARSGGEAYARELFDLAVGGSMHWTAATCPGQLTSSELEALAQTLGDHARMHYALQIRAQEAWNSGRNNDAMEILSQQTELAVAPFQRAHSLIWMAQLQPSERGSYAAAAKWLKEARQAFDGREFPVLEADWQIVSAMGELKQGQLTSGEQHMNKALALIRGGVVAPDLASSALISFARLMSEHGRPNQTLAIVRDFDRYGVADTTSRYKRAAALLGAYALLGNADAFAKGEREIQQLGDISSPDDAGLPTVRLFTNISNFYEKYGKYEAALKARKQMEQAVERSQQRANDKTRIELQEKLNVALKDKENARLMAEAELQSARQRGWITAFTAAALGVIGAGAALAVAVRRGRRLGRLTAELAERNGELEQRSATRLRLLAAACHDLRQPAHALGILAELGSEANEEPSRFTAWLQSVRRSTASLSEMLDELMDLGRLDGGHYTPQLSAVSLSELLQEVMLHFGPLAKRKGLILEAPPVEGCVVSDRHLLRRMLFNLVSNSIKYTDTGSVRVTAQSVGADVRLSVTDTGPGIPQDKLDDVFRDYVRLNPLKAAEGLGIGLSIVRRSANLLGHALTLTSAPDQGTTATLVLPRSEATTPVAPAAAASPTHAGPGGVLAVIEDDAELRAALVTLLQRWQYTVYAGADASAVLAQLPVPHPIPNLVITDLHLGATNGLAEVAQLRAALACPDLPALMVTGDLDDNVAQEAAKARVYVSHKPLSPRKLGELVNQLMGPSRAWTPNAVDAHAVTAPVSHSEP